MKPVRQRRRPKSEPVLQCLDVEVASEIELRDKIQWTETIYGERQWHRLWIKPILGVRTILARCIEAHEGQVVLSVMDTRGMYPLRDGTLLVRNARELIGLGLIRVDGLRDEWFEDETKALYEDSDEVQITGR